MYFETIEEEQRHWIAVGWARRHGYTRDYMVRELVRAEAVHTWDERILRDEYKHLPYADLCDKYERYLDGRVTDKKAKEDIPIGDIKLPAFKEDHTTRISRELREFAEKYLAKKEDKDMPNVVSVVIRVIDPTEGRGEVIEGSYPAGATTLKHPRLRDFASNDVLDVTLLVGRGEVKWGEVTLRGEKPAPVKASKKVDPLEGWTKIGSEYFSPAEKLLFETAMNELQHRPVILQAVGDSGYGKTSRFHAWANYHNMTCLDIHCPTMRDPAEWFGYEEVGPQGTYFAESAFSTLLQEGNGLPVLDEITRVNPLIANSLLSVLDFRHSVRIHGRTITVGQNLLFGMTANKGLGYTATYEMDAALMRRVDATFEVAAPPVAVEKLIVIEKTGLDEEVAEALIRLFKKLREANHDESNALQINTGSAIKIGMLVRGGMTLRQAVQFVSVNTAPLDMRHDLITQVNSELNEKFLL